MTRTNQSTSRWCVWLLVLLPAPVFGLATVTSSSIVTGANGYVGRAVVHELIAQQQSSILCLVRPHRVAQEEEYWQKVLGSSSPTLQVLPYDMLDGGTTL